MKRLVGFALSLVVASLASAALACSVPVFRYALERWQSDPYELVVFQRGPLTVDQEALLERFVVANDEGESIVNLELRRVDTDGEMDETLRGVWEAIGAGAETPALALLPPLASRDPDFELRTVWTGPLDERAAPLIVDSPLRRDLAEQLLAGETAVWVLLESGNTERDEAAHRVLEAELAKATETLKLPEVDEQDMQDGLLLVDPANLKVSFSLRRVARDDPAEAALVGMLLASEPDLLDYDAPMAFPIFGRGRVLYALVGEGINPDTIAHACGELIGPCTCQVKEQNPGTDLVMAVDWDRLVTLTDGEERPLPPLPGLPDSVATSNADVHSGELEMISPTAAVAGAALPGNELAHAEAPTSSAPGGGSTVIRNTVLTAGVAVLGIAVVGVLFLRWRG